MKSNIWKSVLAFSIAALFIFAAVSVVKAEKNNDNDYGSDKEDDDSWDFGNDFDDDSGLGYNYTNSVSNGTITTGSNIYTVADVRAHNTTSDCWIIIEGGVYDMTNFIDLHPGGDVFDCGTDQTSLYTGQHGQSTSRLAPFLVGTIGAKTNIANTSNNTNSINTDMIINNTISKDDSSQGLAQAQLIKNGKNTSQEDSKENTTGIEYKQPSVDTQNMQPQKKDSIFVRFFRWLGLWR